MCPRSLSLQSNSVPQWAQCFPSPREVVPFQLNWFFPSLLFFRSSQQEVHAFSMTSNKGQSLVWMRRVPLRLRHLHHHKAQDRKLMEKQEKAGPQMVKPDPLISGFCRHLEIEQKTIHLVFTVKLFGLTHWQTEGYWESEIARDSGEVQSAGFCIQYMIVCGKKMQKFQDLFPQRDVLELLSKFALKHWLLLRA